MRGARPRAHCDEGGPRAHPQHLWVIRGVDAEEGQDEEKPDRTRGPAGWREDLGFTRSSREERRRNSAE